MVEVPVAGLAALRRTDGTSRRCAATLFDPRTAEFEAMVGVHYAFHAAIAAASGNPLLELITLPLHAVADPRELTAPLGREFWVRVDADHRAILGRGPPLARRAGRPRRRPPGRATCAARAGSTAPGALGRARSDAPVATGGQRSAGRRIESVSDGWRRPRLGVGPVTSAAWAVSTCQAKDCSAGMAARVVDPGRDGHRERSSYTRNRQVSVADSGGCGRAATAASRRPRRPRCAGPRSRRA